MISIAEPDCRPLALREASDLLQAMAHPIRLQLLDVIRRGACAVTEMVAAIGLAQPIISRHLAVLRRAGIVHVRPRGRERIYCVAECHAKPLIEILFHERNQP